MNREERAAADQRAARLNRFVASYRSRIGWEACTEADALLEFSRRQQAHRERLYRLAVWRAEFHYRRRNRRWRYQ